MSALVATCRDSSLPLHLQLPAEWQLRHERLMHVALLVEQRLNRYLLRCVFEAWGNPWWDLQ